MFGCGWVCSGHGGRWSKAIVRPPQPCSEHSKSLPLGHTQIHLSHIRPVYTTYRPLLTLSRPTPTAKSHRETPSKHHQITSRLSTITSNTISNDLQTTARKPPATFKPQTQSNCYCIQVTSNSIQSNSHHHQLLPDHI